MLEDKAQLKYLGDDGPDIAALISNLIYKKKRILV